MRIYVPTNWGWYVAALIILGPVLAIWLVEPDWLGRLIGLSLFFGIPPIIAFWYTFGPRKNLKDIAERKNLWPGYVTKRIGNNRVDLLTKVLCFAAGVWWLVYMSFPFAQDVQAVISDDAPLERTGIVAHTRGNSLTGFITEEVVLDKYPVGIPENTFKAWYFTPRHIMKDNTYEFLYLPKTHIVLDAQLVSGSE